MTNIKRRKLDHVMIVSSNEAESTKSYFDDYGLKYRSLPELNFEEIESECSFAGIDLSLPLIVSAMTGGDSEVNKLNRVIADACSDFGIPFSYGSLRVLIENPHMVSDFRMNHRFAIGNLGLHQFNYGISIDDIKWLIDELKLDMFGFHVNPLQEVLQKNGDTNFENLAEQLSSILNQLKIPILVKDVGMGIDPYSLKLLDEAGVHFVDVAGKGGTNWVAVEGLSSDDSLHEPFLGVGYDTPSLLLEYTKRFERISFVAGGGVRSGADIFKSICMGAVSCSMAGPIITASKNGYEEVCNLFESLKKQFRICMFITGCKKFEDIDMNCLITANV